MASTPLSIRVNIDEVHQLENAPTPANGDPYVAVLKRTNENGVAIDSEPITLGTGYESMDDIAHDIRRRLAHTREYDLDIDFVPDTVDVFGIVGQIDLEI